MSNTNTTKPAAILQFEKALGFELEEVASEEVMDQRDSFALNQQGKIIGLSLVDNQISNLSDLQPLTQLTHLDLWNNKIRDLSGLQPLTQLTSLDLSGNQIRDLSGLQPLTQLTSLDLSGNQISDLSGLQPLTQLTSLCLNDNQISEISLAFLNCFPNLETLYLSNNPIKNVPEEIFDKGWMGNVLNEVRHYLEDIEKGQLKVYQAKVILIGNGRVGKTCLVKRWLDNTFDPKQKSTHAIQLQRHSLKELKKEKDFDEIQLQIWDFGGQDIYHATHRLFMQTCALFILVWDQQTENALSQTEKLNDNLEITYQNYPLHYWLDYAKNLGDDSPILIVQTKKDWDGKRETKDWNFLNENYNIINKIAIESSNAEKEENGFEDFDFCLKKQIRKMLKETCTALPESWWKVQLEIQALQKKETKSISVDEFFEICQKYDLDQDHAKILLHYLHDTGLLFYRENLFQNQIILDQKWAIDAVYTLFDRKGVFPRLVQKGIFSTQDLKYAWQDFSQDERELCLDFMKSSEICFEIEPYDKNVKRKPFEERQFLAPALLPEDKPNALFKSWEQNKNKKIVRYQYRFLHYGNLQSFFVRFHKEIDLESLWKYGCQIEDKEGNLALIEGYFSQQKQYVEIQITGENPQVLLDKIRNELEKIQKYDKVSELWSIDGVSFVEREKVEQHPKENPKIQTIDGNWLNYSDFALFLNKNPEETFFMPAQNNNIKLAKEKLSRLEGALILETNEARKFQLEYEINELKKILNNLSNNVIPSSRTANPPKKEENIPLQDVQVISSQPSKPSNKKIYFSYAWGDKEKGETREEIVNQLYDSLKKEGFDVRRDKIDLGYRSFISEFMQEIGEGDLIVVVISDKYFKSPYCMFELYEIAKNSKLDKHLLAQRILPIMVESINFSSPDVLESYFEHWETEEKKWEDSTKKRPNELTYSEYKRVKLISQHFAELVHWLKDINMLTTEMLSANNFEEIKKAIQESN